MSAIERLFVEPFMDAHREPPVRIDCYYYLPLYIFCGRHLLAAKLRSSAMDAADGAREEVASVVAQIRERWPATSIVIRCDSGFCCDDLMSWCEENKVKYVLGLAGNARLVKLIARESRKAKLNRSGRKGPLACSPTSSTARERAGRGSAA